MLKKMVSNNYQIWDTLLQKALMHYRSSEHNSTQFTPYRLMFGREMRIPIDIIKTGLNENTIHNSVSDFVSSQIESIKQTEALARENIQGAQKKQKDYYDRKQKGTPFCKGDLVMLFNSAIPKGTSKKFFKNWSGPWRVVSVLSDLDYRIEFAGNRSDTRRRKLRKVVHFNHLKQFYEGHQFENQDQSSNEHKQNGEIPDQSKRQHFGNQDQRTSDKLPNEHSSDEDEDEISIEGARRSLGKNSERNEGAHKPLFENQVRTREHSPYREKRGGREGTHMPLYENPMQLKGAHRPFVENGRGRQEGPLRLSNENVKEREGAQRPLKQNTKTHTQKSVNIEEIKESEDTQGTLETNSGLAEIENVKPLYTSTPKENDNRNMTRPKRQRRMPARYNNFVMDSCSEEEEN